MFWLWTKSFPSGSSPQNDEAIDEQLESEITLRDSWLDLGLDSVSLPSLLIGLEETSS